MHGRPVPSLLSIEVRLKVLCPQETSQRFAVHSRPIEGLLFKGDMKQVFWPQSRVYGQKTCWRIFRPKRPVGHLLAMGDLHKVFCSKKTCRRWRPLETSLRFYDHRRPVKVLISIEGLSKIFGSYETPQRPVGRFLTAEDPSKNF